MRLEAGKQHLKFEVIDAVEELVPEATPEGPDLLERQREAIARFAQNGLLENEGASVALSSLDGQMRIMTMPFSDSRKIEAVLPGMLEAEVPFELSDMTFAWHRQDQRPVIAGDSDQSNIRIAFGRKQSIATILHMLHPLGLDPRQMLLGSAALYELVRDVGYDAFRLPDSQATSAIIDLGHRGTNLCVFDHTGIIFTRSFLIGGQKLSEDIAQAMNISFEEAQALKHEKLNLLHTPADNIEQVIQKIARTHYEELAAHISRMFIASKSSGIGGIGSIALVGGAAKAVGLDKLYTAIFNPLGAHIVSLKPLVPHRVSLPSMAMAYSLALSGIHVHAKESRFNFRKDEFAWRGEFDFLRAKSGPLLLWGLALLCAMAITWAASSLVLGKENKSLEAQIHAACAEILGQQNMPAKKCLNLMREQISAKAEVEIPEFTAADVYLRAAQGLPKDVPVVISEMDISEKKVRITAESPSYADIDKVVALWSKIPCFVKVENTGAQPAGAKVKYSLTNDIDCQVAASGQEKTANTASTEPATASTPEPAIPAPGSVGKAS
jgi:general secretion pathway protein L